MKLTGAWALLLGPAVVAGSMLAASPAADAATAPGVITTVAGGAGQGPARQVWQSAASVAVGRGGVVDIGDTSGVVRQFPATARYEKVVAGTGVSTPAPAAGGVRAKSANLGYIGGLAYDHAGNMIIADAGHFRIWVLAARSGRFYGRAMKAGDTYAIAGTGAEGYSGDGGPALAAKLDQPRGVAVDKAGNVLVADSGNDRVRVIAVRTGTYYGQKMAAGDIYTIAGDGSPGVPRNSGPATKADLDYPEEVAVDGSGNVLITDPGHNEVRVVAVRTGTYYGQQMTAQDIYAMAGDGKVGDSGDGGAATSAEMNQPYGVAVDHHGNVVIADTNNDAIRVVAEHAGAYYGQQMTAGDIYTIGTAPGPYGIALDAAGNVVIAPQGAQPDPGGVGLVDVVAARTGSFYGQHMTVGSTYGVAGQATMTTGEGRNARDAQTGGAGDVAAGPAGGVLISSATILMTARASGTYYRVPMTAGDIYTVAGGGTSSDGDGIPATSAALNNAGIAMDHAHNLLIADGQYDRIRVVAARSGTFYGQAMKAGDIYTIAGDGKGGYSGDGGPATKAELRVADSVTVDAHGNVIIADTRNYRIRVLAESTGRFYGQAMKAGDIYTVAGDGTEGYTGDGGPATQAELDTTDAGDQAVAVGSGGTILIADSGQRADGIRAVAAATGTFYGVAMKAGDIYTIAGNGKYGYSGDGGPATAAELAEGGVSADSSGNAVIADTYNSRIRVVAARTGDFYGQAMTAGYIYTVAGDGQKGFSGDGGKAVSAALYWPVSVAVSSGGVLLIGDTNNMPDSARVRQVR